MKTISNKTFTALIFMKLCIYYKQILVISNFSEERKIMGLLETFKCHYM